MKLHSKLQKSFLIFFLLFLTLFIIGIPSSIAEESEKKSVLILHAYHKGFPWTDNINLGIEDSFSNISDSIELTIEYMDSKANLYNSTYEEKLLDLYQYKYGSKKFDLIISSDDNAIDFLREYGDQLFPDTPIVFCGVNNLEIPELVDRNLVTGLLEIVADRETLDLMLSLHPSTNEVVIITDNTPSGIYRLEQILNISTDYPEVNFTCLNSDYTLDEIEIEVAQLSEDSIIIFSNFYRDSFGTYYSLEEGISRVSNASLRPVYAFHSHCLPYGIIGGKLLGGYNHGQMAANMGFCILNGEDPLSIPIVERSTAQYMFNYVQLERFNINIKDLPPDSIILNQPFSFYRTYTTLIWVVTGFATILFSIIALLGININKRIQLEYKIKEANEELELRVKNRTKDLEIAQERLLRQEKLATIGKIAGSIGHEIRNPLGTISNSTYFLNMKLKNSLDEKVKKHLTILQKEILRINKIITDLLDFTRIKQISLKDVDINIFLEGILEKFNFPDNIIIKKNLKAELPKIQIDPNQIQQGFQILLLNAVEAMPEGGKLEIKTLKTDSKIKIIIKDTGVGIPKENLTKIFEPLFTTKTRGIGLGLSIIKDIIEKHDGMIYAESEVGVGTIITFTLPILRKDVL